jgi:ASC-1-like (ASCH) protein
MEYLTDEQMKREKPLKNAYTPKNNAMEKFLSQSTQFNMNSRKNKSGRKVSVFYSARTNRTIILN